MKVLITGIGGAVGSYLAEYLVDRADVEVCGILRSANSSVENLKTILPKIKLCIWDMTWRDFLPSLRLLKGIQPDVIFHLASWANVRESFEDPATFLHNNIIATSNLFETVLQSGQKPTIVLASTSEVYGKVMDPSEVPIKETNPLRPANPYAVSKTAQDLLAWTYFNAYGMKIIRTRAFGYINPRRADLVSSSFARQIAMVERGLAPSIRVGNLSSVRSFLDVRDIVNAYWLAAEKCKPGEAYNIGSPVACSIEVLLNMLIDLSGSKISVERHEGLIRPADITNQVPDISKFIEATGWKAEIPLYESLIQLLDYWRMKV